MTHGGECWAQPQRTGVPLPGTGHGACDGGKGQISHGAGVTGSQISDAAVTLTSVHHGTGGYSHCISCAPVGVFWGGYEARSCPEWGVPAPVTLCWYRGLRALAAPPCWGPLGAPTPVPACSCVPVSAQMDNIRNNAVLGETGSLWGSHCASPHPSSPPCGEKTPTLPWWPWRGPAKSRDHSQGNV